MQWSHGGRVVELVVLLCGSHELKPTHLTFYNGWNNELQISVWPPPLQRTFVGIMIVGCPGSFEVEGLHCPISLFATHCLKLHGELEVAMWQLLIGLHHCTSAKSTMPCHCTVNCHINTMSAPHRHHISLLPCVMFWCYHLLTTLVCLSTCHTLIGPHVMPHQHL